MSVNPTHLTMNGMTLRKSGPESRGGQFINYLFSRTNGEKATQKDFYTNHYVSPQTGKRIRYRRGWGSTLFTALTRANVIRWDTKKRSYVPSHNYTMFVHLVLTNRNVNEIVNNVKVEVAARDRSYNSFLNNI